MRRPASIVLVGVLTGLVGAGLVVAADASVAQLGGEDDLVWALGLPSVLLAGTAVSGRWTWKRTDGSWRWTLGAIASFLATFALGLYVVVLVALSQQAVMAAGASVPTSTVLAPLGP